VVAPVAVGQLDFIVIHFRIARVPMGATAVPAAMVLFNYFGHDEPR